MYGPIEQDIVCLTTVLGRSREGMLRAMKRALHAIVQGHNYLTALSKLNGHWAIFVRYLVRREYSNSVVALSQGTEQQFFCTSWSRSRRFQDVGAEVCQLSAKILMIFPTVPFAIARGLGAVAIYLGYYGPETQEQRCTLPPRAVNCLAGSGFNQWPVIGGYPHPSRIGVLCLRRVSGLSRLCERKGVSSLQVIHRTGIYDRRRNHSFHIG